MILKFLDNESKLVLASKQYCEGKPNDWGDLEKQNPGIDKILQYVDYLLVYKARTI